MSPEVQYADANGITLAYEVFGSPADPAIVLVMGLGTQMLAWPDPLCEQLAAAGHYVVRFDNRDVGLSTHLKGVRTPHLAKLVTGRAAAPYTVDDLAADTAGLIDALGLDKVDLVGASMGGFIAQTVALRYPHRLRSLTLLMTSTGSRRVGRPRPHLVRNLMGRRRVPDRAAAVELSLEIWGVIGSPGFPRDEAYLRDVIERSYDRGTDPGGYYRQLAAILTQPDRTAELRELRIPTLIIHGLADPLVSVTGGLALARTIPRAKFVGFSGMGHDLPRDLWPEFATEILGHIGLAAERDAKGAPVGEPLR